MPVKKCITLYTFDELSDDAKEKAREWARDGYEFDDFDSESVIDDAKEIGKLMGIVIDHVYYSGFSSQGDGAQFTGFYSYAKDSVKQVNEYAPQDTELHRIVKVLFELQKPNFYRLEASVKHSGHYHHEFCTSIDVSPDDIPDSTSDELKEILRDFMHWIYRQLEKEYEYRMSDESIDDFIKANEYTFEEDGTRRN